MDYFSIVQKTINNIEEALLSNISTKDLAKRVHISESVLQKQFQFITTYTIAEYIRNRRLYEAAIELINTKETILNIGLKYGYESPDSFTKAMTRFFGTNPKSIRKTGKINKNFRPLLIRYTIHGGERPMYRIIEIYPFSLLKGISTEEADISGKEKLWEECYSIYGSIRSKQSRNLSKVENEFYKYSIGEYAVYSENELGHKQYAIAGRVINENSGENDVNNIESNREKQIEVGSLVAILDGIDAIDFSNVGLIEEKLYSELQNDQVYEPVSKLFIEQYHHVHSVHMNDNEPYSIMVPVRKKKDINGKIVAFKTINILAFFLIILAVGLCSKSKEDIESVATEILLYGIKFLAGI